jgi:hypothetical protein
VHDWPNAHPLQLAPPTPHVFVPFAWQTPFVSQQPWGHETPSHAHEPFTHSCPFVVQSVQLAPPAPQVTSPLVWQLWLVSQQPPGHEWVLHPQRPVVVSHCCRLAHALHAAPVAPHEPLLWFAYGKQTFPAAQQPSGHVVWSHVPLTWPSKGGAESSEPLPSLPG